MLPLECTERSSRFWKVVFKDLQPTDQFTLLDDVQQRQVDHLIAGEPLHRRPADRIQSDQVTSLEDVAVVEEHAVVGVEVATLLGSRNRIDAILAEDVRSQHDDDLGANLLRVPATQEVTKKRDVSDQWHLVAGIELTLLDQTSEDQRPVILDPRLSPEIPDGNLWNSEQVLLENTLSSLQVIDGDIDQHRDFILVGTADPRFHHQGGPDVLGPHLVDVLDEIAAVRISHDIGGDKGRYLFSQVKLALAIIECVQLRTCLDDGISLAHQCMDSGKELGGKAFGGVIEEE